MKRVLSVFLIVLIGVTAGAGQSRSAKQFSDTFAQVVEKVNPAVVTITSEKIIKWEDRRFRHPFEEYFGEDFFKDYFDLPEGESRNRVLGSGVIVDAGKGYILTNNHVVEGADEINILLIDEREFSAEVIGTDPQSDVAVLKIDTNDLVQAEMGDSDELRVGEWILAIGSPFSRNLSHTVTAGIVSAKGRSRVLGGIDYQDFIQTDAAINPGNSGGALVNLDGELVGINTAIATGGFSRGNVGVGFAIPINLAKNIMDDLVAEGRVIRSWLGVFIQDVDDGIAKAFELSDRQGAVVTEVVEDSPADEAGIKVKDVIVIVDGTKIRDSSHLKNVISSSSPGTRSEVEVIRRKRQRTIRVDLAELPQEGAVFASRESATPQLGMDVQDVSEALARRFQLDEDESGAVVVEVLPNSVAARAGIQRGDLIKRVGDEEVDSARDFRKAVSDVEKGAILFLVKRRGGSLFIPVENM
ncbi:MAG: Do family serine endopeptidase [Candidatus Marinimicrobia bacterium]|jgi:serine protease Do|nr:Do family serine endopeptidase [Candidatus Neomarinimicrobiota bacterium]MDP6593680.1 Do family serine endopeptidase [Candidatus Neomarinimicrobiota bacterium]MDP6836357.1 Do family serine endopeptidase [Candidatus Neomarinimicrobiota bacterium]|tara:strand:- start:28437 stop:29846 length:1410 start_codon:yes stop_codon:yes gene_type:complete